MNRADQQGLLAGFAVVVGASIFASWTCFYQLGGYDLSPLIDLFWRMRGGETPGADFINTFPLLLLLIAKLVSAAHLGWYELTAADILVTVVSYCAVVALTPPARRSVAWCMAVAVILSLPLVYTNHIWHSSLSQRCAILFFFALYIGFEDQRRASQVSIALTAALLALTKQNVALPMLASALPVVLLLGGRQRWRMAASIVGGSAAGILVALALLGMTVGDFVASYTAVLGRGRPGADMSFEILQMATNRQVVGLTLSTLLIGIVVVWRDKSTALAQAALVTLFAALSALPLLTDWDAKMNDVPLPLFVASVSLLHEGKAAAVAAWTGMVLPALLCVVATLALAGGYARERMYNAGAGAFWEPEPLRFIDHGYFAGMHVGKRLAAVLSGIERVKAEDPRARVFFGPRIEFGYAFTGSASPRRMPLWWHPGTSYAKPDEPHVVQAFAANRFNLLIFLKGDRTRMPTALLGLIDRYYATVPGPAALDVYRLRSSGGAMPRS